MEVKVKILEAIRSSSDYTSGQELSSTLKITRTAIWKHVNKLRRDGYKISARPRLGYKLERIPDQLLPQEIKHGLTPKIIGKEIIHSIKVDSTINLADKLAKSGCANGTVVVAEKQTAGKGRMGRSWSSPKGGIWASIILRPSFKPSEVVKLNFAISLAIVESLKEAIDVDTDIKWPNDILFKNKKLAGVLTEVDLELDKINYAIVSFGLNVNNRLTNLPAKIRSQTVTLKDIRGKKVDRVKVLQAILKVFEDNYLDVQSGNFNKLLAKWKKHCLTLGRRVKVRTVEADYNGTATGIDQYGRLILRLRNGKKVAVLSGDIV